MVEVAFVQWDESGWNNAIAHLDIPRQKRLWYFAPLYVWHKLFANDLAYDKLVISDSKDGQFIDYPGQLNLWHCHWLSEWRFDFTMTTMTTRISTNQGFLCTMHSLQCNCARDLFGHPRGLNLWFLKLSLSTNLATQKPVKSLVEIQEFVALQTQQWLQWLQWLQ